MKIIDIKEKRKKLITESNPEWKEILDLRSQVRKEFQADGFLSISTYSKILDWKLKDQKSQIRKIKSGSPDSLIKPITKCYLEANHPDEEMNLRIKLHVLLSIPWIGIGIASSILALHEPKMFGGINIHSWFALYSKHKKTFSINDYLKYLKSIREMAVKIGCDVQEIEFILRK